MRHSPCRAHYEQATAAASQPEHGSEKPLDRNTANAYELMLAKLAEDKRRLKDVKSVEKKAEVKAQILPDYLPWITGVLQSEAGRQDDVLMTVFVWSIDIGNFNLALDIGAYAIEHQLVMPDQYKRDVPCVLAEEIADFALRTDAQMLDQMFVAIDKTIHLTADNDMPDEVRAKLHKAHGYSAREHGYLETARESLTRALALHDKVGVKKDIERLDTLIKNSTAAVNAETPAKTEAV